MERPQWFPRYKEKFVESILELKDLSEPGIYFIKYPEDWSGEDSNNVKNLLDSLIGSLGGGFLDGQSTDFSIGKLHPILDDLLNESFEIGPRELSFGTDDSEIRIFMDGEKEPLENDSYKELVQTIRALNILFNNKSKLFCFHMSYDNLDSKHENIVRIMLERAYTKINENDKYLIIFYSDDSFEFTENFLWKDNYLMQYGGINKETAFTVLSYNEALDKIESALESQNSSKLDLFLGAGASLNSGLPSGEALVKLALQDLLNDDSENKNDLIREAKKQGYIDGTRDNNKITFEYLMSVLLNNCPHVINTKPIKRLEETNKAALNGNRSEGYSILEDLSDRINLVLTTNFDELTENALNCDSPIFKDDHFENAEEIINGANESKCVKLHGTIANPRSLVIQEEHVAKLPETKKKFMQRYIGKERDEKVVPVFFIGYDFGDLDILNEFLRIDPEEIRIWPIIVNPEKTKNIKYFMKMFEGLDEKSESTYLEKSSPSYVSPVHIPFTFDFFLKELEKSLT